MLGKEVIKIFEIGFQKCCLEWMTLTEGEKKLVLGCGCWWKGQDLIAMSLQKKTTYICLCMYICLPKTNQQNYAIQLKILQANL